MSDIRSRSYGWVQNPSSFSSLHKVVCLFNPNSEHYKWMKEIGLDRIYFDDLRQSFHQKFQNNCTTFSYLELVGTSSDKNGNSSLKRNQAVADGLIQVTILPQKINTTGKTWTDNWTADGFLRWAVTLGFLKPNRQQDTYSLTDIGKEFSNIKTGDCDKAIDILTDAFLSYPPACRILDLLSNQTEYVTKFYLGSQLGFIGENGFTSYPEDLMFDWLLNSTDEEITKIRSDVEGTSDKYARGICGWLNKVGLVQKGKVVRQGKSKSRHFIGYKITAKGLSEYKRACGSSKNTKKPKFVMWEFLATATVNRDYVRSRRSFILEYLLIGSSPARLLTFMQSKGFYDPEKVLLADITGFQNFGIRIDLIKNPQTNKIENIRLLDKLNLDIPEIAITKEIQDIHREKVRANLIEKTDLPIKHLALLDLSVKNSSPVEFEMATVNLFSEIYKLHAKHLGGSRKPDGIAHDNNQGIIIDTKAYADGYSKNIQQQDEMVRYIEDYLQQSKIRNPNEWWQIFPERVLSKKPYFLWISSKFTGSFDSQLTDTAYITKTTGGAITAEELLWGAHLVQSGKMQPSDFFEKFNNTVIKFSNLQ